MRALADSPPQPVVDRARERVIQTLLVWRARALPAFSSMALVFIWLDPRPWRIALLTTAAVTLAIISLVELRAFKRDVPLTPMRVRVNLVVSGLCQLGLMIGSGALASPIAPAVLIVALMFNLSAPRRLAAIFVLTVHVPAVWLLALAHAYDVVPGLVPFPGFATASIPAFGAFLAAFGYTLFFLGAVTLGQWIRGTLDAAVEERVAEQQRLLELHRDTARTMSSLSAEIAHELKNPLASIKGLAGLLRRDVDGAGKERLEVMRGEIDRMQAILEEFLHYSRPVVPLELRATSLRSLAQEVLALHEGMALTRDVALELSETDVVATCDPRKVRQILVNVVQNAIEASPARGLVRLALSTRGREVIVDVEDQGSGLDPEVRGSLFEVGATTKPKGSGIGLAVARGLARQHEGELTLEDREGGGCRARLVLPIDGPHVEPSAETATTPATEVASSRASRAPSAAAVSHTVRAEELSP
jgi:two-component system sensor histidine kinase HydH